jgi:hypothetical protein
MQEKLNILCPDVREIVNTGSLKVRERMQISDKDRRNMRRLYLPLYIRAALLTLFLCVQATDVAAANYTILTPLTASNLSYFYSGLTINSNANPILTITNRVYINGSGLIGLGAANYGARLDVKSSGSGKVQIWRDSGGTERASMSDAGALTPPPTALKDAVTSTVLFFNLGACPSGWTELTAAGGRYLVGLPASGSLAGTQGSALSNLANRAAGVHNHNSSVSAHSHATSRETSGENCSDSACSNYPTDATNANTGLASTGVTVKDPTCTGCATAGTNAPYIQLLVCQRN